MIAEMIAEKRTNRSYTNFQMLLDLSVSACMTLAFAMHQQAHGFERCSSVKARGCRPSRGGGCNKHTGVKDSTPLLQTRYNEREKCYKCGTIAREFGRPRWKMRASFCRLVMEGEVSERAWLSLGENREGRHGRWVSLDSYSACPGEWAVDLD